MVKDLPEMSTEDSAPFNMAVATLKRIDFLLREASYYSSINNYKGWKLALDNIFREAITIKTGVSKEKKLNYDHIKTLRSKLNKEYIQYLADETISRNNGIGSIRTKLPFLLDQFEIKLRNILNEKGLIMPSAKDIRYIWSG